MLAFFIDTDVCHITSLYVYIILWNILFYNSKYSVMISKVQTLQDLVSTDELFGLIMKRFDVEEADMKEKISRLAAKENLDMNFLTDLLIAFEDANEFSPQKLRNYPIQLIINYLKKTHQFYISSKLPQIEQSIYHLDSKVQGNNASLKVLKHFFSDYKKALTEHIEMEEKVLFPYILHMSFSFTEKRFTAQAVQKPYLNDMLTEHDHEHEDRLEEIVDFLSKKKDGLENHLSFKVLLTQFETFKRDLRVHERLEEEVLIPQVIELENKLNFASLN